MSLVVAVILLQAYLLGSIPFGLLLSKAAGKDIRQLGSGNIGATNVWRALGKKWGILTFALDVAKGWLAVVLGMAIAGSWDVGVPLPRGAVRIDHFPQDFAGIVAALGVLIGHSFPVWIKFKGGKGVATSLGVMIGVAPLASLVVFAVWGLVLRLTGYVSVASIIGALSFPIVMIALLLLGQAHGWGLFYFACAAALLVILRHLENIKRLVAGTEHRFGARPPAEEGPATEPPRP
ncbi:MAG: glycerol-3-phosphate 1-O-acyltransferase PlsY [Verrucomicrobiota bacterium]|nr:glycerol-3-phosphate 1-O-acyltransferase PlsY [Verrucomicrobiota bacterium]